MIIEEMGGQQRGWQCVAEGAAEDNRGEGSGSEGDATGGKETPGTARRGGSVEEAWSEIRQGVECQL